MYIIEKTGELVKCYNKDIALDSHNVVVVISQNQKKIYTWIGKNASAQSKFACARETARMRMETGYKIVTIEGDLTSNEFLEAVDESVTESSGQMEPVTMSSSTSRTTHKTTLDTTTTIQTKDTVKTRRTSETLERTSESESVSKGKVEGIVKELIQLPAIENKICDYLIIDNKLYLHPGTGDEIILEHVNLADGHFIADDYIPRLFVKNGKILAVELWREE